MTKKEEKAQEEMAVKKENDTVKIYLGPEIPGIVSSGRVFSNGYTRQVKKALEEFPVLDRLFVPVKDIVKAKKELKNENSSIYVCYKKACEYAAKKGEKRL